MKSQQQVFEDALRPAIRTLEQAALDIKQAAQLVLVLDDEAAWGKLNAYADTALDIAASARNEIQAVDARLADRSPPQTTEGER